MIRILVDKIKNTEFVKNIVTLASGVIIAAAINAFGLPFLSRVYTSAQIGEYDLIISKPLTSAPKAKPTIPKHKRAKNFILHLVFYLKARSDSFPYLTLWRLDYA